MSATSYYSTPATVGSSSGSLLQSTLMVVSKGGECDLCHHKPCRCHLAARRDDKLVIRATETGEHVLISVELRQKGPDLNYSFRVSRRLLQGLYDYVVRQLSSIPDDVAVSLVQSARLTVAKDRPSNTLLILAYLVWLYSYLALMAARSNGSIGRPSAGWRADDSLKLNELYKNDLQLTRAFRCEEQRLLAWWHSLALNTWVTFMYPVDTFLQGEYIEKYSQIV